MVFEREFDHQVNYKAITNKKIHKEVLFNFFFFNKNNFPSPNNILFSQCTIAHKEITKK